MFGIDSSEFLLIAVVALLVIGPKDLPRVMRLVGGWVGRGKAMTRHLRAGFDTMMREAELEEMQKQWAQQNADIMAATASAAVAAHAYDAPHLEPQAAVAAHAYEPPDVEPHAAVVGDHPYDHPGALPLADAAAMTGPQPPARALADPVERTAARDTPAITAPIAAAPIVVNAPPP